MAHHPPTRKRPPPRFHRGLILVIAIHPSPKPPDLHPSHFRTGHLTKRREALTSVTTTRPSSEVVTHDNRVRLMKYGHAHPGRFGYSEDTRFMPPILRTVRPTASPCGPRCPPTQRRAPSWSSISGLLPSSQTSSLIRTAAPKPPRNPRIPILAPTSIYPIKTACRINPHPNNQHPAMCQNRWDPPSRPLLDLIKVAAPLVLGEGSNLHRAEFESHLTIIIAHSLCPPIVPCHVPRALHRSALRLQCGVSMCGRESVNANPGDFPDHSRGVHN